MAIEHLDFDGTERLALVTGAAWGWEPGAPVGAAASSDGLSAACWQTLQMVGDRRPLIATI